MNDNLLKPEGGWVIGEIPYVYNKPSTLFYKFTEQIVKRLIKPQEKTESSRDVEMIDCIKYLNDIDRKYYLNSNDRLIDDGELYTEFILHPKQERYSSWVKANSKNLKPILEYKGDRKVKSRLRKKKSICVGHIDNDGCYHMLMGSPSFKGLHNFFSRVLSYPKRLRKKRKLKRR